MRATLYSDASFDHVHQVGGWAAWARSDEGRIIRSGVCPPCVETVGEAELSAIFAGMYLVSSSWPSATCVLVRSDSQEALRLITGEQEPRRRGEARLVEKVKSLDLIIHPRWVKAHQNTASTEAYINGRVDAMARKAMRVERELRNAAQ